MWTRELLRVAAIVCLVGAAAPGAVGTADRAGAEELRFGAVQPLDPDDILLRINVTRDGTARWVIEYRTRLDDPNVTEAFRGLRENVSDHPAPFEERFARRMNDTVATAEAATDRQMRLENVTVSAESRALPQRYGVVTYAFEWRGFAARDGERLIVGDALAGLFLDEQTQLRIDWPPGYEPANVDPSPDERGNATAMWNGPTEFGAAGPSLVLVPADGGLTLDPLATLGAAATVVLAGGVLYLVRDRATGLLDRLSGGGRANSTGDGTPAAAPAEGDASTPVPDAPNSDVPRELLSNEERVVRALARGGGRMRQQELVAELGWTEAKTSQVVRRLRESGEIEGFRLGRENVLSLPERSDETEEVEP